MAQHLTAHALWASLVYLASGTVEAPSGSLASYLVPLGCWILGYFMGLGAADRGPMAPLFRRPPKKPPKA